MTGSLINAGAIIAGSILGIFLHRTLPVKYKTALFQGLGLVTLVIGALMAIKTENLMIQVFSIVLGTLIGEWIDFDEKVSRIERLVSSDSKGKKFAEGFLTSTLLFCVGSMAILGAIEEGLGNKPTLLLTKSLMDGISSVALSSAFGIGVLFSSIPLLIYQGGLTLLASFFETRLSDHIINELTSTGGILLIGLAFSFLEIKKIKIINMVPALLIVIVLSYFF